MISTTLIRRSAPRLVSSWVARQGGATGSQLLLNLSAPAPSHVYSLPRASFSTAIDPAANAVDSPPAVTNKVRVLNMDVVKNILNDLASVDVNNDGRIDTDELKTLLRNHHSAFTEEEIVEIGELFYAGKSGGSVPFDQFVQAIDRVVQQNGEGKVDHDDKDNRLFGSCANEYLFYKSHGNMNWNIEIVHKPPETMTDRLAFQAVKLVRLAFDTATGWNGEITPTKVLNRTVYLETIAGVPGMVAAIIRHFKSLRTMQRDGGMIQMFLDEANNERMHLLTFVRMKDPGVLLRAAVVGGQFGFGTAFLLAYMISPAFCHRFVGYIEEEAVATYSKIIKAIEEAPEGTDLAKWRTESAPSIGRAYWHLGEEGTVLDLMYAVRADEAEHRDVNHLCVGMKPGMSNPVFNAEEKLNTMLLRYVQDLMERDPDKPVQAAMGGKPSH